MGQTINYIVTIDDWFGHREICCETELDAWDAIGSRTFGGLYKVSSPTGLDTSDFIPF